MLHLNFFLVFGIGIFLFADKLAQSQTTGSVLQNILTGKERDVGDKCVANPSIKCDLSYKYRTFDGSCVNPDHPTWGMAGSVFTRLLPALYKDGKRQIRTQVNNKELVSPRVLSTIFFTDQPEFDTDMKYTVLMCQFGQVLAHDMSGTLSKTGGSSCCTAQQTRLPPNSIPQTCEAINVPSNDKFYSKFKVLCLNMNRSKNTDDINCDVGPVLPINHVTAYIDASLLYGSAENANNELRMKKDGLMSFQMIDNRMYPPNVQDPKISCNAASDQELCIKAGDFRSNAGPNIVAMQVLLLRLHNWIAAELKKLNKHWNDGQLFEESRRILIACLQMITYGSYLVHLLGKKFMDEAKMSVKTEGYNDLFDSTVHGQMTAEFSGVAFRCLHSTITGQMKLMDEQRNVVGVWNFEQFQKTGWFVCEDNNFDKMLRGMATQGQGRQNRFFPTAITDKLFQVNGVGTDLESLDIGRNRDYGMRPYPDYFPIRGKDSPKTWEQLSEDNLIDKNMVERLQTQYPSMEDIDLFVGAVLENVEPDSGSLVGPLLQKMIGHQFSILQKADKFYFESKNQSN
ncbi:peroxidase-like isoform X2 [Adelges cooleyi]|uniref:peroxidase-like isoform X2 n=1 Tax=Adelges cooleyi TaxID=133065 RepID=UPI00217F2997|nr:peroxidase-like isoform X2 [Adelges cooleyi]